MSEETDSRVASFLYEHPQLLRVLFALTVIAGSASTAAAQGGGTCGHVGP